MATNFELENKNNMYVSIYQRGLMQSAFYASYEGVQCLLRSLYSLQHIKPAVFDLGEIGRMQLRFDPSDARRLCSEEDEVRIILPFGKFFQSHFSLWISGPEGVNRGMKWNEMGREWNKYECIHVRESGGTRRGADRTRE